MLILTRRINESIVINGNIKVTILDNGCGSVKIGIDAPREISVNREEIHERVLKSAKGGANVQTKISS